jgi:pyruvate kinase
MTASKAPEIRVSQFNNEATELTPEEAFTYRNNPKASVCKIRQSIENIF